MFGIDSLTLTLFSSTLFLIIAMSLVSGALRGYLSGLDRTAYDAIREKLVIYKAFVTNLQLVAGILVAIFLTLKIYMSLDEMGSSTLIYGFVIADVLILAIIFTTASFIRNLERGRTGETI